MAGKRQTATARSEPRPQGSGTQRTASIRRKANGNGPFRAASASERVHCGFRIEKQRITGRQASGGRQRREPFDLNGLASLWVGLECEFAALTRGRVWVSPVGEQFGALARPLDDVMRDAGDNESRASWHGETARSRFKGQSSRSKVQGSKSKDAAATPNMIHQTLSEQHPTSNGRRARGDPYVFRVVILKRAKRREESRRGCCRLALPTARPRSAALRVTALKGTLNTYRDPIRRDACVRTTTSG